MQLMLYVLDRHLWRDFENTCCLETLLGKQTWTKVALSNVCLRFSFFASVFPVVL